MSTSLLLVNVGGTRKRVYQELSKDYSAIEPPFWAALTAGFIRKKGFDVKILDANAENLGVEETAEEIEKINPALINIVAYGQQPAASTQLMTSVRELCKAINLKNPGRKMVLTGLHPSALPEKTLQEEQCDFVCQGEGFHTLLGLLEKRKLNEIPGLWWKDDGKIKSNIRAKNIENLDAELSDVAWDLLPMGKYKAHNWQCLDDFSLRNNYASISTSLGCPFRCTFCSIHATFGEHKVRYWSPDWVLKQIDTLVKEHGVRVIKIIDELFFFNPEHFMPIVEGLIKRDYGLNIWAYARTDITKKFRKEELDKIRKAGFKWLCLGFESADEDVRKEVSKGQFKQEDIKEVVKKIKNAGINIMGNFMFGLPEEDIQTMQKTLDLALALQCEFVNFYSVMAYPGSQLHKDAINKGWKLPDSWSGYSQHSYDCLPLPTNKISAEEVLKFRDYAFDTYFKNPDYLKMIEEKFGMIARGHIENMTQVKLKRKLLENDNQC